MLANASVNAAAKRISTSSFFSQFANGIYNKVKGGLFNVEDSNESPLSFAIHFCISNNKIFSRKVQHNIISKSKE